MHNYDANESIILEYWRPELVDEFCIFQKKKTDTERTWTLTFFPSSSADLCDFSWEAAAQFLHFTFLMKTAVCFCLTQGVKWTRGRSEATRENTENKNSSRHFFTMTRWRSLAACREALVPTSKLPQGFFSSQWSHVLSPSNHHEHLNKTPQASNLLNESVMKLPWIWLN